MFQTRVWNDYQGRVILELLSTIVKMRYPNHLVDICFVWSQFISYGHIAHVIGNFVCK